MKLGDYDRRPAFDILKQIVRDNREIQQSAKQALYAWEVFGG